MNPTSNSTTASSTMLITNDVMINAFQKDVRREPRDCGLLSACERT
jgi:hypothetical protein